MIQDFPQGRAEKLEQSKGSPEFCMTRGQDTRQAGPRLAQVTQSLASSPSMAWKTHSQCSCLLGVAGGEDFPVQAVSCWINNSQSEAGRSDLHPSRVSKDP